MRKLVLISAILFTFASCKDRNNEPDCNCTKQRFERSAIRSTAFGAALISASPWVKVGFPEPYGSDCRKNGIQIENGSFNSYYIPPDRYGVQEYYYLIECK